MKQYSLKKTILLTLLAIIIICVPVTYFILKNLDALHAKEGEQYSISLAEITPDQQNTPPGETIHFSASANGGKGTLFFEFFYMQGEEKKVIQEKSEQSTTEYQFPELGRYTVSVTISDESPWTEDVTVSCWYGACHEGIDVSHHQGTVDWAQIHQAGYDFAMIRTGYGHRNDEKDQTDTRFAENIVNATTAGMKVGVYHISYAMTPEAAKEEAQFCLSILEPYRDLVDYPVAFDIETVEHSRLPEAELEAIVVAFCEEIEQAGYTPMVYLYDSWLTHHPGCKQIAGYDIWTASWQSSPQNDYDFIMWQYTNEGELPGIETNVDINYAYCDYSKGVKIPNEA